MYWKYTTSVIKDLQKDNNKIPEDTTQIKINAITSNTNDDLANTVAMRGAKNGIRHKPSKLN